MIAPSIVQTSIEDVDKHISHESLTTFISSGFSVITVQPLFMGTMPGMRTKSFACVAGAVFTYAHVISLVLMHVSRTEGGLIFYSMEDKIKAVWDRYEPPNLPNIGEYYLLGGKPVPRYAAKQFVTKFLTNRDKEQTGKDRLVEVMQLIEHGYEQSLKAPFFIDQAEFDLLPG